MKCWLLLVSMMAVVLSAVGQRADLLDPTPFKDMDSDSVYHLAERGYRNLAHAPGLRLQYGQLGLDRAKAEQNDGQAALFATNSAVVYTELGMNQEALEYGLEALTFSRKTKESKDDVWSLIRLSDIRFTLRDTIQALQDAREALALSLKQDSQNEIGWGYNSLGEFHRKTGRYDSAAYFYREAMAIFEQLGDERGRRFMRQNLGMNYAASGNYDAALEEFDIAKYDSPDIDILFELEKGEAMLPIIVDRHSRDSAIVYAREMLAIAERDDYPKWQARFAFALVELYQEAKDYETAFGYRQIADSLREIQIGERVRLQSSVANHQYRMQLLSTEYELQAQQNQNRVILWFFGLVVAGLLGFVATTQIVKNQRIRKINAQLSRKNEDLDELIKEKDIWMNLMVHDLKAPLNSIGGLLEMLRSPDLPPVIREKVLNNIDKSVRQGSELISQLLEISRLESDEIRAEIQNTNINDLVAETRERFLPTAEKKNIELHTEVPPDPVHLSTDPVHAQRILENLVSNALKFSPGGTSVRLQLEPQPDSVAIHVIDQGPGMSEEDQKNLFLKFKKLSARPTGGESSTGLGLSIVKELAERIDARIQVDSTLGKGARFTLSMPRG
ncbi:MAG: tetratricopeptide repeat-containing sensor histidine kinase [Bacteroidota bacterium]